MVQSHAVLEFSPLSFAQSSSQEGQLSCLTNGSFSQNRREQRFVAQGMQGVETLPQSPWSENIYPDPNVTTFYLGAEGRVPLGFVLRVRQRSAVPTNGIITMIDPEASGQFEIKIETGEHQGVETRGERHKCVVANIPFREILEILQDEERTKELFEAFPERDMVVSLIRQFKDSFSDPDSPIVPLGAVRYTRREFVSPDGSRLTKDSDVSCWGVSQDGMTMHKLEELSHVIYERKSRHADGSTPLPQVGSDLEESTNFSKLILLKQSMETRRRGVVC